MYGNGARTGMAVTAAVLRPILQDHHRALAVFFVAVAGTAARGAAECLFVAASVQTTGTSTAVCALPFRNYNYIPSFCTKL